MERVIKYLDHFYLHVMTIGKQFCKQSGAILARKIPSFISYFNIYLYPREKEF